MKNRISAWGWKLLLLAVAVCGGFSPGCAQDPLPKQALPENRWTSDAGSEEMRRLMSFVPVETLRMPAVFRDTENNVLSDPSASLNPFWQKLSRLDRPVRIVHIGDSHIRGHVFPYEMRMCLETDFGSEAVEALPVTYQSSGLARETGAGGLIYHIIGVNGATCGSFSTPERIDEIVGLQPDLVIVSFGTNEAHGRRYVPSEHLAAMRYLTEAIRRGCPETVFLLTTPPGAYRKVGRRGHVVNPNTPRVVDTELDFARESGCAVWDLYHVAGGQSRACLNWSAAGMFQRDKVHFTHEGYKFQGLLFHEAFIKAYNKYVADRLE